jgi:MFS family permease
MSAGRLNLAAYWRLVRDNRNFRRLWMAQIVSEIGDWFYVVTLYSLLLQFTGKAQSVGWALVLQVLPSALVGATAGVVNDRIRRQHVMIAADLFRMVIVASMMLVRSPQMIWLVYPLLFLETVMWGFFEPARSAVIPNVVGEDQVLIANTVSSVTWSVNFALGSGIGGLFAVLLGRDAIFTLNALSFLLSAVLLGSMRFDEPHAAGPTPFHPRELVNFSPVAEGIRYIRRDRRLLATIFLKGGIGIMGANWVIFPIMGQRLFPVRTLGLDAPRAAALGMSPVDGRSRSWCAIRTDRGLYMGRQSWAAHASRNSGRLCRRRVRIHGARWRSQSGMGLCFGSAGTWRRIRRVGLLDHLVAALFR